MRTRIVRLALAGLLIASCSAEGGAALVAAGTTVVDSGLLDQLADDYEASHPGARISILANPTGLILEMGRQKAADLLITHAPAQEQSFVDEGGALMIETLFVSRFILVGPPGSTGRFEGLEVPEVFRIIAEEGLTFVSRGDGSGTYDKEAEIWQEAGLDPSGQDWYVVTGQGMGPTLLVADQRQAFTLSELGAFRASSTSLRLVDVGVVEEGLENPYSGIVVADSDGASVAAAFLSWLVSADGKQAILAENEELFGEVIYDPASPS